MEYWDEVMKLRRAGNPGQRRAEADKEQREQKAGKQNSVYGYYSGVVLYVEKRLFNGSIQTKIDFDARRWHVRSAGIASRRPFRLNCARGCRIFNLM